MDKNTLTELDYYRIRDTVAYFCVSAEGKAHLIEREPFTDPEIIESSKKLASEWQIYNTSTRQPAISSWPEIHPLFPMMKIIGASLSLEQAHALSIFCTSVKKAETAILNAETELSLSSLPQTVRAIPDLSVPAAIILHIITPNGEMKDLPEIREIRTRIASLNTKIRNIMHSFTSDQKLSDALESNVPAYRAGHQVLAVKVSQRNRIPGIIHEVSQSGQTVYIEPEDAVRAGNDLMQEEANLQIAVRNILRELTKSLSPFTSAFEQALPVMITLDCSCAVSRWGIENKCVYTLPCDESQNILLIQARHPLLGANAVPVDVRFMAGKRVLIITGPNTGGKTVTLKTIALFAMLNQSGFPVPAAEGSRIPVFTGVFADIGDGQSLDQSLSTFSAHMKNIARAINESTSASLVLLDELGSGTDPQEGAAIGMAVLDTLIEKKAFVLVTTHQGVLKNYGYTHPSCINASVEFSSETLSPTYRLLMGVPGESRALDIAQRSGLNVSVVEKARSYIATEQADISALIKGLTAKHTELDAILEDYRQKESELSDRERTAGEKEFMLRQKEHELKTSQHTEVSLFLTESRKELENLVRTLREGEITREKTLAVKDYISRITEKADKEEKRLREEAEKLAEDEKKMQIIRAASPHSKTSTKPTKKHIKNSDALRFAHEAEKEELQDTSGSVTNIKKSETEKLTFKPGASVMSNIQHRTGTLISSGRKGQWLVQFGDFRMTIREKDLTLIAQSAHAHTPLVTVEFTSHNGKEEKPQFELRLLGLREDEAIRALEHQLDLCTVQNFRTFSIIHGKGTGVLQQAVQDYLSHFPGVKEFHFAPPEDGGTGKTYVTLR